MSAEERQAFIRAEAKRRLKRACNQPRPLARLLPSHPQARRGQTCSRETGKRRVKPRGRQRRESGAERGRSGAVTPTLTSTAPAPSPGPVPTPTLTATPRPTPTLTAPVAKAAPPRPAKVLCTCTRTTRRTTLSRWWWTCYTCTCIHSFLRCRSRTPWAGTKI